jgi:hypothetical protein
MVGWKRWFYDLVGWEYDIADEKQRRQKYLVCEQIKKSNHRLTLNDREEKKRPPTPIPDKTLPCFEELMFDIKKHSYAEILTNPKKRKRKRKSNNINF